MSIAEKLTTVAENVPKVYDAGKQAEYDAFWDTFQDYGKRKRYAYAFYSPQASNYWSNTTLKPKYPIQPTEAQYMFNCTGFNGDLTRAVDLDFSKCTNFLNAFAYAFYITKLGVIDFRQANTGSISCCLYCRALETIEEIILKEDGTQFHNGSTWSFTNCDSLKNINITGVIPFSANFQYSPLTKESITSVINALSSTATGKTVTFKKTAKEAAFTDDEWAELIATKTNWTISLV